MAPASTDGVDTVRTLFPQAGRMLTAASTSLVAALAKLRWKAAATSSSHIGNSGIFYLAQEAKGKDGNYLPIWQSCSEYQVLDNANHEDANQGKDGNRQAASLYDMIPAVPQNAKPYGEWNTVKIRVFKGSVWHYQNGEEVLEYHLWTPKWKEMLDGSKFCKGGEFPAAYDLMIVEGQKDGGYIAFQDHGDDVWYRNVRIKLDE